MEENKEKKIKSVKTWTITYIEYEDNTTYLGRINDGFSSLEILGIITLSIDDIMQQIKGIIKPDIISRTIIKD